MAIFTQSQSALNAAMKEFENTINKFPDCSEGFALHGQARCSGNIWKYSSPANSIGFNGPAALRRSGRQISESDNSRAGQRKYLRPQRVNSGQVYYYLNDLDLFSLDSFSFTGSKTWTKQLLLWKRRLKLTRNASLLTKPWEP